MSIASELQDKIDAKAAIKASIEAKGVTVGDVKLNQYASKVDAIAQDPSIPVGVGQHLVTFYDFDGKVLKRQRVNTGEGATAPAIPTHQFLTFAEWNNPFTNVQSDIDIGAIYNTTDGKTYLFITLTPVTGFAPTLYFSKSSTSLMTIDWGDGTTSTSTTSGNQSINHVYAVAGDYIVTLSDTGYSLGYLGAVGTVFLNYKDILTKVYFANNIILGRTSFQAYLSLKYVSLNNFTATEAVIFYQSNIRHININSTVVSTTLIGANQKLNNVILKNTQKSLLAYQFAACKALTKLILHASITTVAVATFENCTGITTYIFLSTTPPTLANINAFTGINPICKIYVPDASVAAYKAATNWNNYSSYIYPLSEKPQSDE